MCTLQTWRAPSKIRPWNSSRPLERTMKDLCVLWPMWCMLLVFTSYWWTSLSWLLFDDSHIINHAKNREGQFSSLASSEIHPLTFHIGWSEWSLSHMTVSWEESSCNYHMMYSSLYCLNNVAIDRSYVLLTLEVFFIKFEDMCLMMIQMILPLIKNGWNHCHDHYILRSSLQWRFDWVATNPGSFDWWFSIAIIDYWCCQINQRNSNPIQFIDRSGLGHRGTYWFHPFFLCKHRYPLTMLWILIIMR